MGLGHELLLSILENVQQSLKMSSSWFSSEPPIARRSQSLSGRPSKPERLVIQSRSSLTIQTQHSRQHNGVTFRRNARTQFVIVA